MKCPAQSPFKPCRRSYGKRKCGGKFIEVEKIENDKTIYVCNGCEKILISDKVKKIRPKKTTNTEELVNNESALEV